MAVRCKSCGTRYSTWQEVVTFVAHLLTVFLGRLAGPVGLLAGPMNATATRCPSCGAEGSWENID
jgi:hypothetical protein